MNFLDEIVRNVQERALNEKCSLLNIIDEEVKHIKEKYNLDNKTMLNKANELKEHSMIFESFTVKDGDVEFFNEIIKKLENENIDINDDELAIVERLLNNLNGKTINRAVTILKYCINVIENTRVDFNKEKEYE